MTETHSQQLLIRPPPTTEHGQVYSNEAPNTGSAVLELAGISNYLMDIEPATYTHLLDTSDIPDFEEQIYNTQGDKITASELDYAGSLGYIYDGLMGNVMRELGFDVDIGGTKLTAMPTPQALVRNAKKFGIDVLLMKGKGTLESKEYLEAFKDKKYPVSTGQESSYKHDTADDHLTAIVMGGDRLMESLSASAAHALEGDDHAKHTATDFIDRFTGRLRLAISNQPAHKTEMDMQALNRYGKVLGISEEEVRNIHSTAIANLEAYRSSPVQ